MKIIHCGKPVDIKELVIECKAVDVDAMIKSFSDLQLIKQKVQEDKHILYFKEIVH